MREDLDRAVATLRRGGLIVYPTDTVWGLGCDATNAEAVARLNAVKQRPDSKSLICLLASADDIERYVEGVPEVAYELLEAAVEPLTVVYDGACVPPLAPQLPAPDGSLAIRVTAHPFCAALCRALRRPLVSTSANLSGRPAPTSFQDIAPELLEAVDYVCTTGRAPVAPDSAPPRPSAIIKLGADGTVSIIRR